MKKIQLTAFFIPYLFILLEATHADNTHPSVNNSSPADTKNSPSKHKMHKSCHQIVEACLQAGYKKNAPDESNDVWINCIDPIVEHVTVTHPIHPLPKINEGIINSCIKVHQEFKKLQK